jgi:hypothetical protein
MWSVVLPGARIGWMSTYVWSVLFKCVRKNECTLQKELDSVHIISGDEVTMSVPKNAISSARDKENTPAYQVRFQAIQII